MQEITVIFPTLARRDRGEQLKRALGSVLAQEGVRAIPLIVVNGTEHDPALVGELSRDPRIRLTTVPEPGIPAALATGRAQVDTPWFSRLDDDDLMLPGALALRLAAFEADPGLDAVVTNGYRRGRSGDTLHVSDTAAVRRDPLRALLSSNWLLPGSWLCRTESIGPEIFRDAPHSLECTYLAVRLASGRRMVFLEEPTVIWHTDVPTSESKSRAWRMGEAESLGRILDLDLPEDFREGIRRKIGNACHSVAGLLLSEGNPVEAWKWHVRSLKAPAGWRYLPYTRRLLGGLTRRSPA